MFSDLILRKARHSRFFMWLLNARLSRMIPFNKPHGFRVYALGDHSVTTIIPYRAANFNHIKGLHACGLATISEFTSGLALLMHLEPRKYRIILQRLEMDYHYQGKMDAFGYFEATPDWIRSWVTDPLTHADSVVVPCEVRINDAAGNHLTTGKVFWQVKPWSKVRTKPSA